MSLYGLRRGEVLGLRWDAVDWGSFAEQCPAHREKWCAPCYRFEGGYRPATVRIDTARVLVDYRVIVKDPKSTNGHRTLPLDVEVVAALRALWVRQAAERLAAGQVYVDSGWVVVNELGEPTHPEWFSDEFGRLLKRAGLPRSVLHEARHTTLSLLAKSGVPVAILSAWAGHHDARFTMANYVHVNDEDLAAGAVALGRLYGTNN